MSTTTNIDIAAAGASLPSLPAGEWDLISFLGNTQNYLEIAGGAIITLFGLAIVLWAVFMLTKKFFGNQQQQNESWVKIIAAGIVGGALLFGGIALVLNIAAGGQTTIEELGGGTILLGLLR